MGTCTRIVGHPIDRGGCRSYLTGQPRIGATLGVSGGGGAIVGINGIGTGIPPVLLNRVAEPFFITRSNDGGLGLSIVYGCHPTKWWRIQDRQQGRDWNDY